MLPWSSPDSRPHTTAGAWPKHPRPLEPPGPGSHDDPTRTYRKSLIPPDFVVGGIHAEKQWGWFP